MYSAGHIIVGWPYSCKFDFPICDNVIAIFAYIALCTYVVRKFFDILDAHGQLRIIVIPCPIQNPVVLEIMLNVSFPRF
jgi:hypothetical protein